MCNGMRASQTCFEGAESAEKVGMERVTFAGPGTVVKVDSTLPGESLCPAASTSTSGPEEFPLIIRYDGNFCQKDCGLFGFKVDTT